MFGYPGSSGKCPFAALHRVNYLLSFCGYCYTSKTRRAGDPGVLPWRIQGFLSLHVVGVRSPVEIKTFGCSSGWGWDGLLCWWTYCVVRECTSGDCNWRQVSDLTKLEMSVLEKVKRPFEYLWGELVLFESWLVELARAWLPHPRLDHVSSWGGRSHPESSF